jgi:hypothetical protein
MNRVWTYIISKPLSDVELDQLNTAGKTFVESWSAHEQKLTATFDIYKKRIIVVKVDEDVTNASGCSIDKLTRFIKLTETMHGVELFNRLLVAYKNGVDVEVTPASNIRTLLKENAITENTIVYNTAVANETELKNWEQALKDTWLNKYLVTS